jgi:pSer/pThr/pTyr-binding forkhead associated (FHA) protein
VQPAWVRCPGCGAALSGAVGGGPVASAQTGAAIIEFKSGPLAGRSYPLERDVTTIGSVEGNTVVLQDTGVSRKHVGIRKVDGGFELADLGSTNGVFVNGEKNARRRLVAGDVIRIGTSEAVFRG